MMDEEKMVLDKSLLAKAARYCAQEEQCVATVRTKLYGWGADEEMIVAVLDYLVESGYIDEHRYARHYCEGKIRLQKWGRRKVSYQLKLKGLTDDLIAEGLESVSQSEYEEVLLHVAQTKWDSFRESDIYKRRNKLTAFLLSRGFEMEEVREVVRSF